MAADAPTKGSRAEFGAQFKFHEVLKAEIALINRRRALNSRDAIELENRSSAVFQFHKQAVSSTSRLAQGT
jgi:hypothetical protein